MPSAKMNPKVFEFSNDDDGDGDGDGDGAAQHGGHTPNTRLTETCSLGLLFTSLILHIHVIIN